MIAWARVADHAGFERRRGGVFEIGFAPTDTSEPLGAFAFNARLGAGLEVAFASAAA